MKTSSIMNKMVLDVFMGIPYWLGHDMCASTIKKDVEKIERQLGKGYVLLPMERERFISGMAFRNNNTGMFWLSSSKSTAFKPLWTYRCCFWPSNVEIGPPDKHQQYLISDLNKNDAYEICRAFVPYILSKGEDTSDMLRAVNLFPEAAACVLRGDDVQEKK